MLEIPESRRRFFIEYETGSATVRDAKKCTSTMAKLDRYGTFLCAPAGNVLADKRETFYTPGLQGRLARQGAVRVAERGASPIDRGCHRRAREQRQVQGSSEVTDARRGPSVPLPQAVRRGPTAWERSAESNARGVPDTNRDQELGHRAKRCGRAATPWSCFRARRAARQLRKSAAHLWRR